MTIARRLPAGALAALLLAARRRRTARAGPPAEPSVAAIAGRGRPAGRRARDPGRRQPRHPAPGGLRLRPPDRLRPQARAGAGHRQGGRRRGRARLHLPSARGPPLVGRRAVHDRGLPLLVGGHGEQPAAQPGRAAARSAGRGRAADGRDPGRADGPLFLVEAQPVLPAGAGRRAAAVHLRARPLPQAVPRALRRAGRARPAGRGRPGARLGAAPRPARRHVPLRQPGPADAAALGRCAPARRRSASSPSATATTTGSTAPASSCPTSTG